MSNTSVEYTLCFSRELDDEIRYLSSIFVEENNLDIGITSSMETALFMTAGQVLQLISDLQDFDYYKDAKIAIIMRKSSYQSVVKNLTFSS